MPLGNATATVAGVMPGCSFLIGGIGVTPADIFLPYELTPQVMAGGPTITAPGRSAARRRRVGGGC